MKDLGKHCAHFVATPKWHCDTGDMKFSELFESDPVFSCIEREVIDEMASAQLWQSFFGKSVRFRDGVTHKICELS